MIQEGHAIGRGVAIWGGRGYRDKGKGIVTVREVLQYRVGYCDVEAP